MMRLRLPFLSLNKLLLAALFPTLLMMGVRQLAGAAWDVMAFFQAWLFVIAVLGLANRCQPLAIGQGMTQFHAAALGLMLVTLLLGVLYGLSGDTFIGWLLWLGIFAWLLGWVSALGSKRKWWHKLLLEAVFMLAAVLIPALIVQIETRFSTEEFFAALESATLMAFWLALRGTGVILHHRRILTRPQAKPSVQVRSAWLMAGLGLVGVLGGLIGVAAYQRSFFPAEAPTYPGISAESPFVCGEVAPVKDTYQGADVFKGLLERVKINPYQGAPEFGFLALGTGDLAWAEKFRQALLAEAAAGLYTSPAGSVKYGQYLAGQRVYFYARMRQTFPDLFSPDEQKTLGDWFAAINQRSLTVEWVDWMYAVAFRYWPQGPYENQENGAGLLALLEMNGLADPNLSAPNQQYLNNHRRGWLTNFRVTDDASVYQPEWMENAWLQSRYANTPYPAHAQLAFDWLKALALPDGSPLRYNHIGSIEFAGLAYWGANLLNDENLLFLAGRALEAGGRLPAQPGAEQLLELSGVSPTLGSCLVYGNSGLPTQIGPLAPDKIILRGGWERDDIYLLLNLRFTGWHRYKATNAIIQLYQGEPLVVENYLGKTFTWLPSGRSLFRDKRIPRENLNGLLIEKTRLSAVFYQLTGIGGPWAQDPPYYATVTRFESGPELTVSSTRIEDWHGWQHQRTIYFYPQGVVAVLDDAQGPQGQSAALIWHMVAENVSDGQRLALGRSDRTEKPTVVMLPLQGSLPATQAQVADSELPLIKVQYSYDGSPALRTATIFLFDEWRNAQVQSNDQRITIRSGEREIEIPLSAIFK